MELLLLPDFWLSLLTLSVLEIVLGIDNIIVIGILVNKLPLNQRKKAQYIGLLLAMWVRILLLLTLAWISHLVKPLFSLGSFNVTGQDIVLFFGGLFLVYKAVQELIETIFVHEHHQDEQQSDSKKAKFSTVVTQIILLDIVFSLDSVITAIGIAEHIPVMIAAIVIAIVVMMLFVNAISKFIERFPIIKFLALTFLVLVGIILILDGVHIHVDKSYAYASMFFSLVISLLYIAYQYNRDKVLPANQRHTTNPQAQVEVASSSPTVNNSSTVNNESTVNK